MENEAQREIPNQEPISCLKDLKSRFALQRWDLVLVVLIALIGARVWERGQVADEGLLGRPLRVGIVSWPGYAGGLVANKGLRPSKDSDFWKRKILVEFVLCEDEAQLLREFARGGERGGLDVIWSTVDSLAQQAPELEKKGLDTRAFMQVDWSRGADAFITTLDIQRVEDLKGKKVAVPKTASQWLFEESLENSELTDIEKTAIRQGRYSASGSEKARDHYVERAVDAAVLWEPDVSEALRLRKGHILVDTRAAANLIADVMVADEGFIQKHGDVIDAFVQGWLLDGTTKAIADPMQAVKVLQTEDKFEKLGDGPTHDLLAKTALATFDDNVEMFGLSGGHAFFDELFKQASRTWVKAGYMADEVNAERARDARFLSDLYLTLRPSVEKDCREFKTRALAIAFQPGTANLSPEAPQILNDEVVSFLLRSHSAVRFCVEASPETGDDPQRDHNLRQAREEAVMRYLEEHSNRPRSQFLSTSGENRESDNGWKDTKYIRLKLISPGDRR